jgi:hydroxyacylglutathione hydrolase
MQLLPDCVLVASGYLGFGLSSEWDSHVYLLRSKDEALLIDTGCGRDPAHLIGRVRELLGHSVTLVAIAVTHGHVDHSGGAAAISAAFGVPVFASELGARWLAEGNEDAVGLPAARDSGVYPVDQKLHSVAAAPAPAEFSVGDLVVRAHPTPGHSADHLVFTVALESGLAMFSGDLVFAQGRVAMLEGESRGDLLEKSIRSMAELRPEHLFPGHGAVALSRGWSHLDAAVASYDRGREPSGLVA